jgi:threonine synthase
MTVAMSRAVASGSRAAVCASTGNTAASAAAYAARAGIKCFVVVPAGKIALGKAVQVLAHGAEIVQIEGNFDAALRISQEIAAERGDVTLVNSVNPDRIEGQKTGAFEVCEVLGAPPDAVALPVGNAGNITSYWKGFSEWREAGYSDSAPRMLGFQAEGASPLVAGHDFESPETVASAIRIGAPASRRGARRRPRVRRRHRERDGRRDPRGPGVARPGEGVFCEPASAAGLAGSSSCREGRAPSGTVVSVLTGHGPQGPRRHPEQGRAARARGGDLRGRGRTNGEARAVISVRVPATSANLGPGYDAVGLALSLSTRISWTGRGTPR